MDVPYTFIAGVLISGACSGCVWYNNFFFSVRTFVVALAIYTDSFTLHVPSHIVHSANPTDDNSINNQCSLLENTNYYSHKRGKAAPDSCTANTEFD